MKMQKKYLMLMNKKISTFNYSGNIKKEINLLKSINSHVLEHQGEKMAIKLFNFASKSVPAYKYFLAENKFKEKVNSIKDFKNIPIIRKSNYLRKLPYEQFFPENALGNATTISATSGSTGEPFYFPRSEVHDAYYEYILELFFVNQFRLSKKKTTLCVLGFGLGIWIGGIFTYKNLNKLSQKGYKLTIVPVGTNKELFISTCKKFAPIYDSVVVMGYPPFIKDVIDGGLDDGMNWKKYNISILTAAEGYSESFRDYLVEKAGIKNKYTHIVNIYGTVEQGTIAHETCLTALIRSLANKNRNLFKVLFSNATSMPTVAQYYPNLTYFEDVGGEIVVTSHSSSIPLVRYAFSDLGGVISLKELLEKCKTVGVDIMLEAKKVGISSQIINLPIVYLFARSDFVVVFRGANIYPEEIRTALDSKKLSKFITGRATILKKENKFLNPVLEINIELKKNVFITSKIKKQIADHIVEELRQKNSEYAYLYSLEGKKVYPKIIAWQYNHPKYFSGGGKQQWVKK